MNAFQKAVAAIYLLLACVPQLLAQTSPGEGIVIHADLIIYNSKVVTMDDAGFTSSPGTIAQAIAVRDNEILALGSNAEVRALAGPQTKQIDLKGRMIMPGFVLTHGHPTDRVWESGFTSLSHVLREGNEHMVIRILKGTPEDRSPALKQS
jgi:adenine deaminase